MRLDLALVARGLARSRSHARQLIDAGAVEVAGVAVARASTMIADDIAVTVRADPYVSRAAHKLIHAIDGSGLVVSGRALDAGASTGGFTQVLLERGADLVYAVDVGHGQLAEVVRQDRRVVVAEGLNVRGLNIDDVGGRPVDLVVADLSFISLRLVLDRLFGVLSPTGSALVLVKPQFEVGRGNVDSHGVVVSETARLEAVQAVIEHAASLGWLLAWSGPSELPGEKGNKEVFCLFGRQMDYRS